MYSGVVCESEVQQSTSPCDPNPCQAGGTCISLASSGGEDFLCRCTPERDGETCQHCQFFHLVIANMSVALVVVLWRSASLSASSASVSALR